MTDAPEPQTARLRRAALSHLPPDVGRPGYDPARCGVGIVHLGPGAFHRAHQAACTDAALAAAGGDWRIAGVSLRSPDVAERLNPQEGLYTLLERRPEATAARVIGSIDRVIVAAQSPGAALAAMAAPQTRIVSLTVTEKAYGISRADWRVIPDHPSVASDLRVPRAPRGVVGLIVAALRLRREARLRAFTVLCCDNLPENGALLRGGVLDFSARIDRGLADWIDREASFPATMVDRITPAPTEATRAEAAALLGCSDFAAIETEAFSQWVIEDRFVAGRPAWQAGHAVFVADVAPYEKMKLRMLNGSHSMLAYAGYLSGRRHVRDVMASPDLAVLVRRHLKAAAATLPPLSGISTADYAAALERRFSNPAIAHETSQIAMDGTEKLPQRLLAPAAEVLSRGGDVRPFAFAVACWMRYALGRTDDGVKYALRDPRESEVRSAALAGGASAEDLAGALHALPGLFPGELSGSAAWRAEVVDALHSILALGMAGAVAAEAERTCASDS
jgi:fructuronate reductase